MTQEFAKASEHKHLEEVVEFVAQMKLLGKERKGG